MRIWIRRIVSSVVIALLSTAAGATESEVMQLTLNEVIETALKHNLNLQVYRIAPDIAEETVTAARSVFDPHINASGRYLRTDFQDDPFNAKSHQTGLQTGIGKTFSPGTQMALNVTRSDLTQTSDLSGRLSSTGTQTSWSITQPLMKNRGAAVNHYPLTMALNDRKKSDLEFKQAMIETVAESKNRYWQLYLATKNRAARQKSLELAKQFLAEVEERVRLGGAARLDSLQAKAEVASREEEVIVAENDVLNRQDSLLSYIFGEAVKQVTVICKHLPTFEELSADEEALIQKGLMVRTDYLSGAYDVTSAETEVMFTKNQRLPQLDVSGTLTYADGYTDTLPGTISTSSQDYFAGSVTVSLEFPWGFRNGAAGYRKAMLALKQLRLHQKVRASNIALEIRTAARNLKSAHKRFQAAEIAGKLAEEKLVAEKEKYKKGLSTSYNVLLYQRDLTNAEVRLANAMIDYQLAIVALNKTVGITLEENGIDNSVDKMLRIE